MTELPPETLEWLEGNLAYFAFHYDKLTVPIRQDHLAALLAIAREHPKLVKLLREIVLYCPYTRDGRCSYCEEDIEDHSPTCLIGKADALVGKETT